jgi:hypothetical protein
MTVVRKAAWFVCLLAVGPRSSHSQSAIEPDALLRLAMKRIEAAFERQRRFTCDAIVSREFYGASDRRRVLVWKDRLHVDVAVFDGEQSFAWPGTGTFRFKSLDEMTGTGASGTGDFGPFAASFLADSDPASIRFRGVGQYDYDVPVANSHYTIKTGEDRFERTAYQGSMFVDPRTGDLRRLVIRAPSPPAGSDVLRVAVDTSYQPQRSIGGPDLFPVSSTLTMTLTGGNEAINRMAYRGCRAFTSKSTVQFDGSPDPPQQIKPAPAAVPPGLPVRCRLLAPIDSRTAAAGDSFEARLVEPIEQDKRILLPKGATLHGRIVGLEQHYSEGKSVRIRLEFQSPAIAATTQVFGKDWVFLDSHTVRLWQTQ